MVDTVYWLAQEQSLNVQCRQEGATVVTHLAERVVVDPRVMVGKPVIRGTRIPVELIVRMLSQGVTESEILAEYPRLQPDDIRACLAYAAEALAHEDVLPLATGA
jgi:uncharacterized protein (DUF433 family)